MGSPVNEDDEQQTEQSVSDPPSPHDDSPSPSSLSISSSSGHATSVANSGPAPISIQGSTMSTVIGSTSLLVPVPSRSDSHLNIETHLRPSSTPDPLVPSSSSPIPISGLVPSTSTPHLPQTLNSASIWRKLTGNASATPTNDKEVKVKKSFLSRKRNDALVRTKSKTTG